MQSPSVKRFRSQHFFKASYAEKCFTQIYRELFLRRHTGARKDGLQYGGRKPTETSVTEFSYKSENLSLEELETLKYYFL